MQKIPQTIIPAEMNIGIVPEDVIFKIIQISALDETTSIEANLDPEKNKPRFRWEMFLEALPEKSLDDIEKVRYTLHPSVPNNLRTVLARGTGFKVKSAGWGVYPIKIEVYLHNGKVITILHMLSFGEGESND